MHEHTTHAIAIRAPWQRIYRMCTDVRQWPTWFAPCQSVELLEESVHTQRMQICALAGGQPMTWISQRTLLPEARRIEFTQEAPTAPITQMRGAWEFEATAPQQTLLRLYHEVHVDPQAPNAADAFTHIVAAIDHNSSQELAAIKRLAESGPTRTFVDVQAIPGGSAAHVFDLLYRVEQWPHILPHCAHTSILYDDDTHQELIMHVDTPHGPEDIRTIRTADAPHHIRYFQPTPPAPLRTHHGAWKIVADEHQITVHASHTITVDRTDGTDDADMQALLDRAESAIRRNSCQTLEAIAQIAQVRS